MTTTTTSPRTLRSLRPREDNDQIAASLIRAGLAVFPVFVTLVEDDTGSVIDKTVAPAIHEWQHVATNDLRTAYEWFGFGGEYHGAHIGVAAGKSGIVVVDIDKKKGKDGFASIASAGLPLPSTLSYETRSGGEHHIYRAPKGTWTIAQNTAFIGGRKAALDGVDVRAGSGIIIWWGGQIADGTDLADAPEWALIPGGETTAMKELTGTAANKLLTTGTVHSRYFEPLRSFRRTGMDDDHVLQRGISDIVRLSVVERLPGGEQALRQALDLYSADWGGPSGKAAKRFESLALRSIGFWVARRDELEDEQALDRELIALLHEMFPQSAPKDTTVTKQAPIGDVNEALVAYNATARKWLGPTYDLESGHAVMAAAAVERLGGDPVWLLTVSGSGNAKTETLSALTGAGATVISTIASEGALLSGTSKKETTKTATGGLLMQMGSSGVLAIKDVTSILSMNRDARAAVLAALREVYDGKWVRTLGTDGGKTLAWEGRLVVVGAVTSAWDKAHAVISTMGDRFVLIRPSSREGRLQAGRQALSNTGREEDMRLELAEAVGAVLAAVDAEAEYELTDEEVDHLLAAADLVTLARTAVEFDYAGNPISADEPEMPTRFAKQLQQVFRGGMAIGLTRTAAFSLAMRCARDSMPPIRLELLEDIAAHPASSTADVKTRLQKPRSTVDRALQALQLLGLLEQHQEPAGGFSTPTPWTYTLAAGVKPEVLVVPATQ